jgi:hypothetical protein
MLHRPTAHPAPPRGAVERKEAIVPQRMHRLEGARPSKWRDVVGLISRSISRSICGSPVDWNITIAPSFARVNVG